MNFKLTSVREITTLLNRYDILRMFCFYSMNHNTLPDIGVKIQKDLHIDHIDWSVLSQ